MKNGGRPKLKDSWIGMALSVVDQSPLDGPDASMILSEFSHLLRKIATCSIRSFSSGQNIISHGIISSREILWLNRWRSCAVLWKYFCAPPASIIAAQTRWEQSIPLSPFPSQPSIYFIQRYFFAEAINDSRVTREIFSGNQGYNRFIARIRNM